MSNDTLRITRQFDAPRERVFDAFISAQALQAWMGPGGFSVPRCEVDARPGGRYRIQMHSPEGSVHIVTGEYREISRPEKLVFTWAWVEGDSTGHETLITLTFSARGAKTEMTLVQTGFTTADARDRHEHGWNSSFDCLADSLAGKPKPKTAQPTILGDIRSTYTRSACLAFLEKGVAYEFEQNGPHTPAIDAVHPFGRIPVLRNGALTLFESTAIMRYVDEAFPGPKLMPEAPVERALVEQWLSAIKAYGYDAMVTRYILQYVIPRDDGKPDRKVIDAALPEVRRQLGIFDAAYGSRDFLVGNALTLADLLLAPIVFYLGLMPEGKELLAPVANVRRGSERTAARASFKATMPPAGGK